MTPVYLQGSQEAQEKAKQMIEELIESFNTVSVTPQGVFVSTVHRVCFKERVVTGQTFAGGTI